MPSAAAREGDHTRANDTLPHAWMTSNTLRRTHSVLRPVVHGRVVHAWDQGVPIEADVWKQVAHLTSVPWVEHMPSCLSMTSTRDHLSVVLRSRSNRCAPLQLVL